MNGYAGKILQIDLTGKKISTIPTEKYKSWVGGHGMGSAIFFDLVKDKTIQGFGSKLPYFAISAGLTLSTRTHRIK